MGEIDAERFAVPLDRPRALGPGDGVAAEIGGERAVDYAEYGNALFQ
jgi:hypothetical protein